MSFSFGRQTIDAGETGTKASHVSTYPRQLPKTSGNRVRKRHFSLRQEHFWEPRRKRFFWTEFRLHQFQAVFGSPRRFCRHAECNGRPRTAGSSKGLNRPTGSYFAGPARGKKRPTKGPASLSGLFRRVIRNVLHCTFCVVHFVGKTLTNVVGIQPPGRQVSKNNRRRHFGCSVV